MRTNKRFIALWMAVCLVIAMLPTAALAADPPAGMINIPNTSAWQGSVFGDVGGLDKITSTNFGITENANGNVDLRAENDRGKISSSTSASEGMAYYFRTIQPMDNFEFSAKVKVNKWTANSQVSFGIMLRQNKLDNDNVSAYTGDYVAVGALDQKMEAFYKQGAFNATTNPVKKITTFTSPAPSKDNEYILSIKKVGDVYRVRIGDETTIIDNFTGSLAYAGLYAARNTAVTFSNISFQKDTRAPSQLRLDTSTVKTDYFVSDTLDLTGLKVTAVYPDLHEDELTASDYLVTGFDNRTAGDRAVTIHFNGQTASIPLHFKPLVVTGMGITYLPAKTEYYVGEYLDPQGLSVRGQYNGAGDWAELASNQYTISVPAGNATVTGATYKLTTPGTTVVTVRSTVTDATYTTFPITVRDAQMTDLVIREMPVKRNYFVGDTFTPAGLVLYAQYSDGTEERLLRSEYTISGVTVSDMSTAGTKTLTVSSYKGTATKSFTIEVKQPVVTGIHVAQYPQTTYEVDQDLDLTSLAIVKQYDNGDKVAMPSNQYEVIDTAFDKTKPGVYALQIKPVDISIPPISLPVTVRELKTYEWKSIRFGQSSAESTNKVIVNDAAHTVQLIALEGGGKITGDHDGISFYYTELDPTKDNFELSANIKVSAYAKEPQDGQESFGIMARDAIGTPGDSSVFASNIAAIGGYSGATTKQNGTQLFVRTGVTTPNGAGSLGVQSKMLNAVKPTVSTTYPAMDYKLTLIKTNNGFSGRLNNGTTESFFVPDIMKVQDQDKMYVGFYVARLATIEVSDINLKVSAAETDQPMEVPAPLPVTPDVNFKGLTQTSNTAYALGLNANVNGTVTIKQGETVLASNLALSAGTTFTLNTTVTANTYTNFSAAFVPDDKQYLTSYDQIVKNVTVDMKTYVDEGDIYVSPTALKNDGGDGTIAHPLDLDTAVAYVRPGQKVLLLDGRYVRNAKIDIPRGNDGTSTANKYLVAAPGAKPIIDFDKKTEGVVFSGSYWHVIGIDFTRTAGNTKGFTIGGSNNIVESSRFYANGDTGLQISRTDESDARELWPSNNLILNCESYDNADPSNNNADGFAAKLTAGTGNVFRGDIAHNNIDDGWDLYTKAGTGAIGSVLIEDSIAYHNGTLTNGSVGAGDKNGFKLGGEGIHVPHVIRNSLAFENGAYGFASNSNPGVRAESTNIAYNNAKGNLNFTTYTGITTDFRIDGFISYQKDYTAKDNYPAALNSATNYMWNGTKSVNQSGAQLTAANFASLVPVLPYERDETGAIIKGSFLRYIPSVTETSGSGAVIIPAERVKTVPDGVQITGNPTSVVVDGKTMASVTIADKDLAQALSLLKQQTGDAKSLVVEVSDPASTVAQLVIPAGVLQTEGAELSTDTILSMRANRVTYNLPLKAIDLHDLAKTLGANVPGITLRIVIEQGSGESEASLRANLEGRGMTLLGHAVTFTVVAEANGKQVVVEDFGSTYVTRSVIMDGALDPNQSTAVWIHPETGEATFVPAIFTTLIGQTTVTMKRPGNSLYAVVQSVQSFDDMKAHWAQSDVELLASKGVIQGTAAGTYSPDASITRAEFAALLVRTLGLKEAGASDTFNDVSAGSWYAGSVSAAVQAGLINGFEDATFRPNERITREQMAVLMTRAMAFAGAQVPVDLQNLAAFADADQAGAWSREALAQAVHAGIMRGVTDTSLYPRADATRAEAAAMLKRFLKAVHFINE
ncbi:hypothetical protein A8709_16980 [Paenibacillus pectinilyticus]|uniref:SLH domain-containing protein n=1 Tax=Paenibacillus pectinilyticus TaxID=512399 RepID=A0A1C1A215_9BACL|nr:S-layer homology domain-containing protein [Paenibacillus pectinilyticus]OCT14566.1 hypothetical protein A8709_16980 [Paenibacillus pectinilyticus]